MDPDPQSWWLRFKFWSGSTTLLYVFLITSPPTHPTHPFLLRLILLTAAHRCYLFRDQRDAELPLGHLRGGGCCVYIHGWGVFVTPGLSFPLNVQGNIYLLTRIFGLSTSLLRHILILMLLLYYLAFLYFSLP